jgi:hypothetical protein
MPMTAAPKVIKREPVKPWTPKVMPTQPAKVAAPKKVVVDQYKPAPVTENKTHNISSDEIDKQEVSKVASQIKQDMRVPKPSSANAPESDDTISIADDGTFKLV